MLIVMDIYWFISTYIQQDATLRSLFISGNCSTCFGWYFTYHQERKQLYLQHLVFVTPLLLPAAVLEELEFFQVTVWQIPDAVDTVVCAPDYGWRYHPKHVQQFPDINKLCKVASCWVYIGICFLDLRDFFLCCRTKQIYYKEVNWYLAYI